MKIKTDLLKELVAKVVKGASNNKMIPITSFIGIEVSNNRLKLTTTDGNNILSVFGDVDNVAGFYTIVNADVFAKLISKTTTEFVELELEDNYLSVKANGKYKLDIPVDSEGNVVKFDTIPEFNDGVEIQGGLLKAILESSSVAVADTTIKIPVLTGYYFGDCVLTTDRERVCYIDNKIFDTPILLSSETANLIQLFDTDTIQFSIKGNELFFVNNNMCLYCKELEDKEAYPVQPIVNLMKTTYRPPILVNKNELLAVLDRMALFVTDYDKNGIFIKIENNDFTITSQKSNATETLQFEGTPAESFDCLVDIDMLKSEVQKVNADKVELYYGDQSSLKIQEGNTTMILSLKHPER